MRWVSQLYYLFLWESLCLRIWRASQYKAVSYQCRDSHVKDKTVSRVATIWSLTWESPYLGKTVFILRRAMVFILKWVPGSSYLAHHEIPWFGRILLQAIMGPNKHSTGGLLMGLIDFFCSLEHYWSLCQKEIKTAHFTVCKLRPRQNDDIFKCIFLVKNCCALSQTPINQKFRIVQENGLALNKWKAFIWTHYSQGNWHMCISWPRCVQYHSPLPQELVTYTS